MSPGLALALLAVVAAAEWALRAFRVVERLLGRMPVALS